MAEEQSQAEKALEMLEPMSAAVKQFAACIMEKALNDIYKADPTALGTLLETRVFCDKKVETDTPAIPYAEEPDGPISLGALGLMNAIAGLSGLLIVAQYGDTDAGVCQLKGFEVKVKESGNGQGSSSEKQSGHGPEFRESPPGAEGQREGEVPKG